MARTYHRDQYDDEDWAEYPDEEETGPTESKGGKPSKGTPADKRLGENGGGKGSTGKGSGKGK
jgi:hypothetical protein